MYAVADNNKNKKKDKRVKRQIATPSGRIPCWLFVVEEEDEIGRSLK